MKQLEIEAPEKLGAMGGKKRSPEVIFENLKTTDMDVSSAEKIDDGEYGSLVTHKAQQQLNEGQMKEKIKEPESQLFLTTNESLLEADDDENGMRKSVEDTFNKTEV